MLSLDQGMLWAEAMLHEPVSVPDLADDAPAWAKKLAELHSCADGTEKVLLARPMLRSFERMWGQEYVDRLVSRAHENIIRRKAQQAQEDYKVWCERLDKQYREMYGDDYLDDIE